MALKGYQLEIIFADLA